jgi:hypothetical protein
MKSSAVILAVVLVLVLVATSASYRVTEPSNTGNSTELATLQDDLKKLCQCVEKFGPPAPVLDPAVLPVDVSLEDNTKCKYREECPNANGCCQPCFDCFGWQLFIALNWPAKDAGEPDAGKPFGSPGDYESVVWQTYKNGLEVFGETQPTAWGVNRDPELQLNSAVLKETFLKADLQSDHNWLTDQDGQVVRYEVRINSDEFHYIIKNDVWHQEGIYKAFKEGPGINLPSQKSEFGNVGAIETKAAWRIIPEARRAYFEQNYKTAHAKVYDPATRTWKDHDVALVGLHIIKKTPNSPQWVWATFEHKDNAPVEGDPGKTKTWNFFNPAAAPDYKPNWDKPPTSLTPRSTPVQLVRVKQPLADDADATKVNDAMHKLIAAKFPRSVWLNYDLISVQWPVDPMNPKPDMKVQKVLPSGQPRPRVLANTTMESYQQTKFSDGGYGMSPGAANDQGPEKVDTPNMADLGKSSCISCHRMSGVTPPFANHPGERGWWTDYSTLFFKARVKKSQ